MSDLKAAIDRALTKALAEWDQAIDLAGAEAQDEASEDFFEDLQNRPTATASYAADAARLCAEWDRQVDDIRDAGADAWEASEEGVKAAAWIEKLELCLAA